MRTTERVTADDLGASLAKMVRSSVTRRSRELGESIMRDAPQRLRQTDELATPDTEREGRLVRRAFPAGGLRSEP